MYLTFYELKLDKKVMLMQIVSSIDRIYQYGFPKVILLKRSTKGAMNSPFRRAAYS